MATTDELKDTDILQLGRAKQVKVQKENTIIIDGYGDEDKINFDGNYYFPHFKPDFSPDTLLSSNYICHFTTLRTSIVRELGGFKSEYNGAQDYDMFLRIVDYTQKCIVIFL